MSLRVFEAFSGVGAQRMALRNLGVDHEVVNIAEVNEFAILSYDAIHHSDEPEFPLASVEEMSAYMERLNIPLNDKGQRVTLKGNRLSKLYQASNRSHNLGDISKVNVEDVSDCDLFTYSFPCTDLSHAGKGLGMVRGVTRSGLLYECERIIEHKRPKFLLLENVKALVGKKFKDEFNEWLDYLSSLGYNNYWQVLNAKDFGVPQNRERVFVVSILKEFDTWYIFPDKQPLTRKLADVLLTDVDNSYYLSNEQVRAFLNSTFHSRQVKLQEKDYADTLLARDYKEPKVVRVGGLFDTEKGTHQAGSLYDVDGLAPTLDTMQGGWRQPSVILDATYKGRDVRVYSENAPTLRAERNGLDVLEPKIAASRGRETDDGTLAQRLEVNSQGLSNTLTTVQKDNLVLEPTILKYPHGYNKGGEVTGVAPTLTTSNWEINNLLKESVASDYVSDTLATQSSTLGVDGSYKIRKLTPNECWRLMG